MSLSALRLIAATSDPEKNLLLGSFYSQQPAVDGLYFRGDKPNVAFYPVSKADGSSVLYWLPESVDPTKLRLGVGDPDQPSTGGTSALNYDGDSTGLTAVSPSIAAATLQAAINANPAVVLTGNTATVALLSTGQYTISWANAGEMELILGDGANLTPQSVVSSSWLEEGDVDTKAVQLLSFLTRPYVYVEDWTETDGAVATVVELRAGAGDAKAMFAVSIAPLPYAGSFSIKDSGSLAYNGTEDQWQEAMGTGWTVLKTGDAELTIERAEVGAFTLTEADVDVTGLSVYVGYTGKLNFNKTAIFQKFATLPASTLTFATYLHIREEDGDDVNTLYFGSVNLHRGLLSSGQADPSNWNNGYYRKTEIDAFNAALHAYEAISFSAAGNSSIAKSNAVEKQRAVKVTAGAGSGAYTRTIALTTTECEAGDRRTFALNMPASTNPSIEFRNATSGGTLLTSTPIEGTGAAFTQEFAFTFNGTAWE